MSGNFKHDGGGLFYQSQLFHGARLPRRPRPSGITIREPARTVPVFRDCEVLVVGGGPFGTAAAIAAARAGAEVVLLERLAKDAVAGPRGLWGRANAPPPSTASSPGPPPSTPNT